MLQPLRITEPNASFVFHEGTHCGDYLIFCMKSSPLDTYLGWCILHVGMNKNLFSCMLDLRCFLDCGGCLTVLLGNAMKNHTGELFSRLRIEWLGCFTH